jgi:hypothetical protein
MENNILTRYALAIVSKDDSELLIIQESPKFEIAFKGNIISTDHFIHLLEGVGKLYPYKGIWISIDDHINDIPYALLTLSDREDRAGHLQIMTLSAHNIDEQVEKFKQYINYGK